MQAVTLTIPRLRCYVAGDRYSIHEHRGEGPIDCDRVPRLGDAPFWPGTRAHAGHLNEPHVGWGHLDHVVQDGHLVGRHLADAHLWPQAILRYVTPLYYFGRYTFAVRVLDAAGNEAEGGSTAVCQVINSSPRAASDFVKAGYEAATDRITFSFAPSPDLGG